MKKNHHRLRPNHNDAGVACKPKQPPNQATLSSATAATAAATSPLHHFSPATGAAGVAVASYPQLDLHGYRKPAAMKAVTEFLEAAAAAAASKKNTSANVGNTKNGVRRGRQPALQSLPQQSARATATHNNSNHHKTIVCIVTGTGSHSGPAGGPVLRTAVESLLRRRKMEFVRNTPGSFLVNATSGETWYSSSHDALSQDTKLILANQEDDLVRLQKLNQQSKGKKAGYFGTVAASASRNNGHTNTRSKSNGSHDSSSTTTTLTATSSSSPSTSLEDLLSGPSVTEVMHEEATLARVTEESKRSVLEHAKRAKAVCQHDVDKAIRESIQLQQQEEQEFASQVANVLKLSEQQEAEREREEQELLERVLRESQQQQQQQQDNDPTVRAESLLSPEEWQAMTEQALTLSLQEKEESTTTTTTSTPLSDDDAQLQEILQKSLYDTVGP